MRNDGVAPPTLMIVAASLLGSSAICSTTGSLRAQEPERVSGAVSCDMCRITMDTIASIGGLEGQGLGVVTELSVVAVDGRGSSELLELRPGVTLWGYATRSALRERGVILHTCNNWEAWRHARR